jgi:hypothetical protein
VPLPKKALTILPVIGPNPVGRNDPAPRCAGRHNILVGVLNRLEILKQEATPLARNESGRAWFFYPSVWFAAASNEQPDHR